MNTYNIDGSPGFQEGDLVVCVRGKEFDSSPALYKDRVYLVDCVGTVVRNDKLIVTDVCVICAQTLSPCLSSSGEPYKFSASRFRLAPSF